MLLLGCGHIGTQLGQKLLAQGRGVVAVRRNVGALPAELPALALDYSDSRQVALLQPHCGGLVVMTPTPASMSEEGYLSGYVDAVNNLLQVWESSPPAHVLFVSSTRVYGDHDGAWVDEDSALRPEGYAGEAIFRAERLLLESPHPVTLVRFAGIYGRWPNRLVERIRGGRICQREPTRYSNRIHYEDCVGFLYHLIQALDRGETLESIYLGVDDAPVSQWQVESWLARQLGVSAVETEIPLASNRLANKRCSNRRLRASGYHLLYPDYKSGYSALLAKAP